MSVDRARKDAAGFREALDDAIASGRMNHVATVAEALVSELEQLLIADEQARLRTRGLEAALRYCMNAYCGADDLDGVVMIEDRPLDNYITEMLTPKGTA